MSVFRKLIAAMILIPLMCSQASAAILAAVPTINNPGAGYNFNANVRGWGFSALSDFDVVALGLADIENTLPPQFQLPGDTGGFATPHSVILWDSSGVQLASVTVQAGTASPIGPGSIGGSASVFRYENLASPISLVAGESYFISAFFAANSFDRAPADPFQGALVFDSRINSTGLRFGITGSHVFPTGTSTGFLFSAASFLIAPSPVPVPAAVWLFGSALIGLMGVARRKRA